MPKLLAFVVCEKVIIDKKDTPSLITIVQNVELGILPGVEKVEIPPGAVVPFGWTIFTIWLGSADEAGKTFHQKIETILEKDQDKNPFPRADLPFVVKEGLNYNTNTVFGFPASIGTLKVKMWLEAEDGKAASENYYYPINVKYSEATKETAKPSP